MNAAPGAPAPPRPAALTGIRVLDLGRYLPAPYAGMVLRDLGADVIKIEEPGVGDPTRWIGPKVQGHATLHLLLDRGKRSLALDLKKEAGREVLRKLVRGSDVLLESFRPGVMERLGIHYEALARENPRLVYCAITGYGQDGPHRLRAGHDVDYQALAGALSLAGPAAVPGLQIADLAGGALPAVIGILAALLARERTGRGQMVDVSMYEGALALLPWALSRLVGGEPAAPTQLTGSLPSYGVYRTADGRSMALGALEPKFWAAFCRAVGRDDLVSRQFAEGEAREALRREVEAIFGARDFAAWRDVAGATDCCLEPVLTLEEALASPLTTERGFARRLDLGAGPPVPVLPASPRLSATPALDPTPPPALGQHAPEILQSLGYDGAAQRQLARQGVTAVGNPLRRFGLQALAALGFTAERGLGGLVKRVVRRS